MRCIGNEGTKACIWWFQSKSNGKENSCRANPSVPMGIKIACEDEHARSIEEVQSASNNVVAEVHQQNTKQPINN